jgi:hypothetical protein
LPHCSDERLTGDFTLFRRSPALCCVPLHTPHGRGLIPLCSADLPLPNPYPPTTFLNWLVPFFMPKAMMASLNA